MEPHPPAGPTTAHGIAHAAADGVVVVHRRYLSARDAHYGGGLVLGAQILGLFSDASTELMVRTDGVEGLLAAYERVDFSAPVRAGDFVEIRARLLSRGLRSRRIEITGARYAESSAEDDGSAAVCDPPVTVCQATMVTVVPR